MRKAIQDALASLLARDGFLLETDVSERTIAAKLACYLAPHFPEHSVDVEYNRHGLVPKRVDRPMNCRGGGEGLILPDVIVHKRGHDDENLLVIQIKKSTNPEPRDCDRAIIGAMKRDLRYKYGLLIDLPAGLGATRQKPRLEWL
jgi:hypothetical protein